FKVDTSGNFTEYATTTGYTPVAICSGPDGNLWYTEANGSTSAVGKITTGGSITNYTLTSASANPQGIARGPDGNLWVCEAAVDKVARVTTSGTVTEFGITASSAPQDITWGPDNELWLTEKNANKIAKITINGTGLTEYSVPTSASQPFSITVG